MAWRQECKLLNRLSTATSIRQFREKSQKLDKLCMRVATEVRNNGLDHLLSDGALLTKLLTAASKGLIAVGAVVKSDLATPEDSRCLLSLFATVDNLLKKGAVFAMPSTQDEAAEAQAPTQLPDCASLAQIQAVLKQTDFISSMTKACGALAAALRKFLQSVGDCSRRLTASAANVEATIRISATVLTFWSVVGTIWGVVAAHSSGSSPQSPDHWSDPQLQTTIEPTFGLLMALLRLESACSSSVADSPSSWKHGGSLFDWEQEALIWDTVYAATPPPNTSLMSVNSDAWCKDLNTSAASANEQNSWSQDTQDLQLFILAAFVGELHQQQQGMSTALKLEPATTGNSVESRGSRGSGKQQQHLHVVDCSEQVLQQLGLSQKQGKQHCQLMKHVSSDMLDALYSPMYIMSFSTPDRLFDSLETSALAISKVRLMAELVALLPSSSVAFFTTICLHRISRGWDCRGGRDSDVARLVLTAVAEGILAPLILDAGPAVLQSKDGVRIRHWASAVQQFWAFIYAGTAVHRALDDGALDIWRCLMQQQPFTTAAIVEAILRAAVAAPQLDSAEFQEMRNFAMHLVLIDLLKTASSDGSDLHEAAILLVSSTTSDSNKSSWLTISHKSQAAKLLSLFISCSKFLDNMVDGGCLDTTIRVCAYRVATFALKAARSIADAAAAHYRKSGSATSSCSAVVAVPWVHVAARALHCCAGILLTLEGSAVKYKGAPYSPYASDFPADIVSWCSEQPKLLLTPVATAQSNNSSSEAITTDSSSSAVSALTRASTEELVRVLQQQSQHLHRQLVAATQQDVTNGSSSFSSKYQLGRHLQKYSAALSAALPTLLCCNNPACSNVSGVSELSCVGRKKCSKCQAAGYCSKECQKKHWGQHKKVCGWICDKTAAAAAATEASSPGS